MAGKVLILLALVLISVLFQQKTFAQNVTSNGAFSHNIPIEMPASQIGPKPEISLSYNSGAGNGIAGIGWGLSGIPAITRNPRYPINFDINDHYLFNGQKLIYNPTDQTYHAERENYLKIQRVDPNTPQSYWIVTKKDGTKLYFGNTADSSIDAIGKGQPLLWALSKVEDAHGNYYKIEYDEDTANGDYYPKKITYNQTASATANLSTLTIELAYEPRPNHVPGYNPSYMDFDKRLKNIEVKSNNQLFSKYVLTYDASSASGVSKLVSVKHFGSQANQETGVFSFDSAKDGFSQASSKGSYTSTLPTENHRIHFGDMNSDGLSDLTWLDGNSIKVKLNTQSGFSAPEDVWGTIAHSAPGSDPNLIYWGDITGDGLPELSWVNDKFLYVMQNLGGRFGEQKQWANLKYAPKSMLGQNPVWADINKDGLTDFGWTLDLSFKNRDEQQQGSGIAYAAINKGNRFDVDFWDGNNQSFVNTVNFASKGLTGGLQSPFIYRSEHKWWTVPYITAPFDLNVVDNFIDIDGNGGLNVRPKHKKERKTSGFNPDRNYFGGVTYRFCDGANGRGYCSHVVDIPLVETTFLPLFTNVKHYKWDDFNKDGFVDFVYQNTSNQLKAKLGQAGGFANSDIDLGTAQLPQNAKLISWNDINSDGFKDIAWVEGNQVKAKLNNGTASSFLGSEVVWANISDSIPQNPPVYWTDINGDGFVDLVWLDTSTKQIQVMQSKGLRALPLKLFKEYTFDWQNSLFSNLAQNSFTPNVWTNNISIPGDKGHFNAQLSDVNGDGKSDLLFRQSNALFKILKGVTQVSPQTPLDFTTTYDTSLIEPTYGAPPHIFDITGEGLSDFLYSTGFTQTQDFIFHKNSGSGFESSKTNWGGISPVGNGNGVSIESPYFLSVLVNNFGNKSKSDFNGDGFSDVLIKDATQQGSKHALVKAFVFLNDNGNGLKPRQDWGQMLPIAKHYVSTFVKTLTGDLNGDGMSDVVNFYADFPQLKVMISEGNKFRQNMYEDWGVYPFSNAHAESGENSQYYAGLHDMNGDSKDDFVYKDTGAKQIMVMLSTGSKFLSPISWGVYENNIKPSDQNTFRDGFADMNGDGLEDFVYRSGNSLKVMLNTGTNFSSAVSVATWSDTITSSDHAFNSGLADVNGDGRLDFVYRSGNQIKVMVSNLIQSIRPELMIKIKNSSGGSFEVSYDNARNFQGAVSSENSQYPKVANSSGMALVKELTTNDGMGGRSTTTYEYHNGLLKTGKREDRKSLGFEWVKKTNPDNSYTKTHHIQDEDIASLDDEEFERLVKVQENYGSDARLYSKTENDYDSRLVLDANGQKSKFVFLKSTTSSVYGENDVVPVVTKTDYEYDKDENGADLSQKYGLVTKVTSFGQTDFDKTEKKTKYAVNSANYVFAPYETSTYGYSLDDQWVLDSKTTNYFDYSNTLGFVEKGLVTKIIRENNDKDAEENYLYDSLGRITTYTDPNSHSTGTSYVLTADGNYIVTSTNALNHRSSVISDMFGRVARTVDANNIASKTEYHADFPWLVLKEYAYENDTLPTVEYEYNFADKKAPTVVKVTGKKADPDSTPIKSESNGAGKEGGAREDVKDTRPVVYTYSDGLGRTIQTKSLWKKVDGINDEWQATDTYYDASGRAFKTSIPYKWTGTPSMDTTTLDGQKHVVSEFDAIGRSKKTTKPDNTFTRAVYGKNYVLSIDEKGHVVKTESLGSETNTYEYEQIYAGNRHFDPSNYYSKTTVIKRADGTKTIDPKGAVTTYNEDMLGNLLEKDNPDRGKWVYTYDNAGNMISTQDARGKVDWIIPAMSTKITYTYDLLGRIKTKENNGTKLSEYFYDEEGKGASKGKLTKVIYNDNGFTPGKTGEERFVYDEKGRIKEKTVTIDNISKTFQFAYDTQDKITSTTLPNGEVVTNNYDGVGNLTSVTSSTNGNLLNQNYNILGQTLQKSYGNGVVVDFTYYDETQSTAAREEVKNAFSYQLKCHNIAGFSAQIYNECFEYEPTMQISKIDDTKSLKNFVYDFVKRVTSAVLEVLGGESPSRSEETAVYDKAGNIENKSTIAYTYKTGTNKLDAVGDFTFEHDANGNITLKRKNDLISTYYYSVDNQLMKIAQPGLTAEFDYFDTSRVKKSENNNITLYFSEEFEVTKDSEGKECSIVNYIAQGLILAQSKTCSGQTHLTYLHHNYQGSTIALTDKDGKVLKEYSYDLFGKAISPARSDNENSEEGIWYVNGLSGNDSENSGSNIERPFATIQKAIDTAQSGDTIYIAPISNYTYAAVTIAANKDNLTITSTPETEGYANIGGLKSSASSGAIQLLGTSDDPLENVTVSGNLRFDSNSIVMEYNQGTKVIGTWVMSSGKRYGISVKGGKDNEIRDNKVTINGSIVTDETDGILVNDSENIHILKNDVSYSGRGISLKETAKAEIKYNTIHTNRLQGIVINDESSAIPADSGITVTYNDIRQNRHKRFAQTAGLTVWVPKPDLINSSNNNFCGDSKWFIYGSAGFAGSGGKIEAGNNFFSLCDSDVSLSDSAIHNKVITHINWRPALIRKVNITVPIIEPTPTPTVTPTPTPTPTPLEDTVIVVPITREPSLTPTPSPEPTATPIPPSLPSPSPTPTPTQSAAREEQLYCGKTMESFAKVIRGTEGIDTLIGTPGEDLIFGLDGIDTIMGKEGNDCIYGGPGIDTIYGGDGDDILYGEAGIDTIFGEKGNDNLYGGDNIDYLDGGQGNDTLDGGLSNDTCIDPQPSTPKISCER